MLNKFSKTNDIDADREEFFKDKEKYMEQYKKEQEELEADYKKMMGKEFKEFPLETKELLEEMLENRQRRIKRLKELKAPKTVIDSEYKALSEISSKLSDEEFVKTESEALYKTKYSNKEEEVLKLLRKKYPRKLDDDEI